MKKTFWTALLAGALAFGMSNAFAQGVSSGKDRDLNTVQMTQAQTHAQAALEAAKGGGCTRYVGTHPGRVEFLQRRYRRDRDALLRGRDGRARHGEIGGRKRGRRRGSSPARTGPREDGRGTSGKGLLSAVSRQPLPQPLTSQYRSNLGVRGLLSRPRISHHHPTAALGLPHRCRRVHRNTWLPAPC